MPYIVRYNHPGLGPRESSVWGVLSDAQDYASTKPAEWNARVDFINRTPEIFPHCPGIAQAIGGKCFGCGKVLTRDDAREWQAKEAK